MSELDEIDREILHHLQTDARNQTPGEIADHLSVSGQTVRNRIEKMEESGVIDGYVPLVNYQKAGFQIRLKYFCTAPVAQRDELAKEALSLPYVVGVDEMLSARENVAILAVTNDVEEVNQITMALDEIGLVIEREVLLRRIQMRPFNHFGSPAATEKDPVD